MSGELLNHLRSSCKFAFNRKVVELNESFRMVFCLSRNSNPTSFYGKFCTPQSKIRANCVHRPFERRWALSHKFCQQITLVEAVHYHTPSSANIPTHLPGPVWPFQPLKSRFATFNTLRAWSLWCWKFSIWHLWNLDLRSGTGQRDAWKCWQMMEYGNAQHLHVWLADNTHVRALTVAQEVDARNLHGFLSGVYKNCHKMR